MYIKFINRHYKLNFYSDINNINKNFTNVYIFFKIPTILIWFIQSKNSYFKQKSYKQTTLITTFHS